MSKRIGIIFLLFFIIITVPAQKNRNYAEVDVHSYELYQQQKWAELIELAKQASEQGIDYFYLQARTGIAYYNLKKYRKSSEWFLKAWENDREFEWLQEYLYFSLINSGRFAEASKIAGDFSGPMKQKTGYRKMKPLTAAFETGYTFNPDFSKQSNRAFEEELNVGINYGEAFFFKNYHFESVDFSHQVAPGAGLNHNFTYLGISREEQVFWGSRNSFPIKIRQYQYFINPWFVLGKKWYFSPSATMVWGNSDLMLGNPEPNTFYSTSKKYSDFIFSASTWAHFGNFSPGAEINRANIYDKEFTQFSGWLTFYPLSNTNFYITPRAYFKSDGENGLGFNTFGISGGVQLGPVHFYGQYLKGEMENFIEPAGYVVSNFPGRSEQKLMTSIYYPFGKKYQLVVRYVNQDIIEEYKVYINKVPSNSLEYKYNKHSITTGISWNF